MCLRMFLLFSANFSDKLSDKGTIDWFGLRKLIKVSECQKRKEEVQLSKYSKGETFYVAAVGGGLVLQPSAVL